MRVERLFRLANGAAWLAWLATAWMLWRGPGVLAYFGTDPSDMRNPAVMMVFGLTAIVLWLLLRRMRRGVLMGRATLWSNISGLAFAWIGGTLALKTPGDWMLWSGPVVLGLALFTLASEPFLRGEE